MRRGLFRFGVIPKLGWLTDRYAALWDRLVRGFGGLFGIDVPPTQPTGSGDTTAAYVGVAMILAIGVVGAAIWSAIDERRGKLLADVLSDPRGFTASRSVRVRDVRRRWARKCF